MFFLVAYCFFVFVNSLIRFAFVPSCLFCIVFSDPLAYLFLAIFLSILTYTLFFSVIDSYRSTVYQHEFLHRYFQIFCEFCNGSRFVMRSRVRVLLGVVAFTFAQISLENLWIHLILTSYGLNSPDFIFF